MEKKRQDFCTHCLEKERRQAHFENVKLFSIEGPVWQNEILENQAQDPQNWEKFLTILDKIESEESILGASGHFMAIGKKP